VVPSFAEARKIWWRIGLLSFGGPAGQIALIHKEVVDERKWIDEQEFLHALNFCMWLPGPEAMQLATYVGWKLHGVKGGLTAGLLFVLPGAAIILALSILYSLFGKLALVESLFWGVKAAVLVIVLQALLRISKKALKSRLDWSIAALAFFGLFIFAAPFPIVILIAGIIGFLNSKANANGGIIAWPKFSHTLRDFLIWAAVWLVPLYGLTTVLGWQSLYAKLAVFFSELSIVTFGGAYAVLSYMGQDVVEAQHWLTAPEMMDGLGLAETTPGPLILVGQFVGFLAASKIQGSLLAGIWGSLIFLWMTFAPCFLWIFVGAPYVQHLQNLPRISGALHMITAAVAGVILNLSLWFGLHVLFGKVERISGVAPIWKPEFSSFNAASFVLSIIAGFALLYFRIGIPKTLAICAALGVVYKFVIVLM
jgi:chromate transporter